jgi:hypothetical protein
MASRRGVRDSDSSTTGRSKLQPGHLPNEASGKLDWLRRDPRGARRHAVACGVLLAATLSMFGDVLFSGNGRILSADGQDLANIFLYMLQFGFEQLRNGKLVLWNPHVYAGTPFLGGFQAALLYPPNWVHITLSLPTAINVTIALDCFLAGLSIYFWTSYRRLHIVACLFAGLT